MAKAVVVAVLSGLFSWVEVPSGMHEYTALPLAHAGGIGLVYGSLGPGQHVQSHSHTQLETVAQGSTYTHTGDVML